MGHFFTKRALFSVFIAPIFDRWIDEFVVTNKRVIIKIGFVKRNTLELNHSKIESVNVHQSIFGRILGYGDIQIKGTGGTVEIFCDIEKPLLFRKKFQEFC